MLGNTLLHLRSYKGDNGEKKWRDGQDVSTIPIFTNILGLQKPPYVWIITKRYLKYRRLVINIYFSTPAKDLKQEDHGADGE